MNERLGLPMVSVILPARNEEAFIGSSLSALALQDYPPDRYEVIVVDNGSEDATATIARDRGARVLTDARTTVGGLRNLGSSIATGEVLAFLDADCIPPAGWIRSAVDALCEEKVGAVGGSCTAPADGTWVEAVWAPDNIPGRSEVGALASSSFIIRKSVFDGVGGFDEGLAAGEDDDLSRRVHEAGYRLLQVPGCSVVHLGYPRSLLGVLRRQVWHGSSQLDSAEGPLDRLLLATHAFAFGPVLAVVFAAAGWRFFFAAVLLSSQVAVPAAAAASRKPGKANRLLQLTVIYWFFFAGRAVGLLRNYWKRGNGAVRRRWSRFGKAEQQK